MLTQPLNQNEQNDVCCKFTTFHIIQVAEVFNQERAFASVRLPQAGMEVKKQQQQQHRINTLWQTPHQIQLELRSYYNVLFVTDTQSKKRYIRHPFMSK